jgi:hypothetical protein
VNELYSFGAGGILLSGAIFFYVKVWVPEQARQTSFTSDWITRLEHHIDELEETVERQGKQLEQCQAGRARLTAALVQAGIPIPEEPP